MDTDLRDDISPMRCIHCQLDCACCCPIDQIFDDSLMSKRGENRETILMDSLPDEYKDKDITDILRQKYLIQQYKKDPGHIKFESVGKYPLLQPIIFNINYDVEDDLWCLTNEELALGGYGKNYSKIVKCLEEGIEGHIISFTKFPDSKHTSDSLILKNRLRQFIDFNMVMNTIQ